MGYRDWFRQFVVVYLLAAPPGALLLIPWVPHQVIGALFILHGLLVVPTFIPNGGWFAPVIRRFQTRNKEVFLTLDDGPDPEWTPRVLELLAAYDAQACFFVIGRKVREYPKLARAIVDGGHELGNHTDLHREQWFWSLLWRGVAREIEGCSLAIRDAAGVDARWFRSPVGFTSPFVYPVAQAGGLQVLGWSAWARDTETGDPDAATARVMKAVCPGAVIVIHPERTGLECLEKVLVQLKEMGYRCTLPFDTREAVGSKDEVRIKKDEL